MSEFILGKSDPKRADAIDKIARFLNELGPGTRWQVIVKRYSLTRSSKQNRYLNGVVYKILGDHAGYERDDVSEFMCGEFWGWKTAKCPRSPDHPNGVKQVPVRTTTTNEAGEPDTIDRKVFDDYKEFCQRFGAQRGIFIPDPDPQDIPPWHSL